ncbi:hypothetical protein XM25_04455 [Devosia sp. H5989]|nr:hypothetical protein XM25_04455 [Devosia sp. H5989]
MSSKSGLADYLRTEFRSVPLRQILHQPVTVLLGINEAVATQLKKLDVETVFDLATSSVFEDASKLVRAAQALDDPLFQHGSPTADMVRAATVAGIPIAELQFLPIAALKAVPAASADGIAEALDAASIRDMALYPGYLHAKDVLDAVYFPENSAGFDPEMPQDLLPETGEFPTERVQYTTLLMDEIRMTEADPFVDIASNDFKPIDLAKLSEADEGFQRIAKGALLTFNQSWYAHGVTLGQLLHSTALAPGESTRVAVIDWSRKSRAGQTEVIDETDDLTNDMAQNRSISEVTKAVAQDAQGGFSSTDTTSHSSQSGTSLAGEYSGGLLGSLLGGPSVSGGYSSSEADSKSHAESYSSSWGRRDIAASMMQSINDRTHQHAHSSRSRRASVVKEVSQSEHENISTRVICNYNHMHALTVQYYEVVQIYQVEVQLAKAEQVLFVPVALIDFNNEEQIRRFQTVLAAAALTREIGSALRNLDVIEVTPDTKTRFAGLGVTLDDYWKNVVFVKAAAQPSVLSAAALAAKVEEPVAATAAKEDAPITLAGIRAAVRDAMVATQPVIQQQAAPLQLSVALNAVEQVNDHLWSRDQVATLAGLLNFMVLRPNSNAIFLPADVWIENAVVVAGATALSVVLHNNAGNAIASFGPTNPVAASQVSRIGVRGTNSGGPITATVTLTLNRNGVRFPLELPAVTVDKGFSGETRVVKLSAGGVNANLKTHLSANRAYYSQAVFRSLDAAQIALLLSGYRIEIAGKMVPVAQLLDPKPIRYVGNYLAFRMGVDPAIDATWPKWLNERGIKVGSASVDVVPLASGGTFAEAVLGRANSAEKLDITRFWNWQDSPIPLQPTEIAAIQSGSRATPEDVTPGQLSSPIINQMAPAALPDPTGIAAILTAIQNGNMFRDMSGLQGTIGLAQAALQATAAGASTAGQQAGTNMQNHLQAQTERMRIAADLAKSVISAAAGVPSTGGSGGGSSNHSQDGAKVNYFDKTAGKGGGAAGSATGSAGGAIPDGGSTSGGASGAGAGGGGTSGASGGGDAGYSQNPGILSATWGDTQPPSNFVSKLIDKITGTGEEPESGAVALGNATKAWPYLDRTRVVTRLNALRGDPDLFDQGKMGLCTAAAFYHHILQRNPLKFAQFANALHGAGVGYLGELKVRAGYDLRNADYAALAAKHPPFPPEADWMLMSALRDSENWIFDFEGDPDDDDISTSAKELSEWYGDTKLYSSVSFSTDQSIAKIKAIKKEPDNHIALWIRTNMISPGRMTGHMITVESPITIDATNKITFDYWTWGRQKPYQTISMQLNAFQQDFFGVITAKF